MTLVKHFEELRVYKQAFAAASRIYRLSNTWPKEERYSLTDQVRRSSRSVCANVAEAWRKRRYPAHFVAKLSDADSEAVETHVWLDFALDCSYVDQETRDQLHDPNAHPPIFPDSDAPAASSSGDDISPCAS